MLMDSLEYTKKKTELRNRQRVIDNKYKEEGLTDEVLDLQLAINKERKEYNIPDENHRLHETYVQ